MLLPRTLLFALAALFALTACGDKDGPEPTDSEEEEEDSATEDSKTEDSKTEDSEDSREDSGDSEDSEDSRDSDDDELLDADGDGAQIDVDCDDNDATVKPGAPETCDGQDEDCDGVVDNDAGAWIYLDADGDGYGDPSAALQDCAAPEGWVEKSGDCDDASPEISPGAEEVCDGVDNDCDGLLDTGLQAFGVQRSLHEVDTLLVAETGVEGLGGSVMNLGDLDGDGGGELVVSASGPDDAGVILLYRSGGAIQTASGYTSSDIAELSISGLRSNTLFGASLWRVGDLDGDGRPELAASAPGASSAYTGQGNVYVFFSNGALAAASGALSATDADLVIGNNQRTDTFGAGVQSGDFDGDGLTDLVISDPTANKGAGQGVGVTYVLLSSGALASGATALSVADADMLFYGELTDDFSGEGLTVPGDIDGDGRDDLVIASPESDVEGTRVGMVYVLLSSGVLGAGARATNLKDADMRAWGGDVRPDNIAGVGDLDGDGLADLAIGTSEAMEVWHPWDIFQNQVAVLFSSGALSVGAGDIDLSAVDLTIWGESNEDRFSDMIITGGDLDGDGRGDLVITGPDDGRGAEMAGSVFVMLSSGSLDPSAGELWSLDADLALSADGESEEGAIVATILEDQDGDGHDELVVGAPRMSAAGGVEGVVGLLGGASLMDMLSADCDGGRLSLAEAHLTLEDVVDGTEFGELVVILDDLDGDGLGELVVGAQDSETPEGYIRGAVSVFLSGGALSAGAASLTYADADFTLEASDMASRFGALLLSPGDIDGDGLPELLVSERDWYQEEVLVYLFYSSGSLASGVSTLSPSDAEAVFVGIDDGIDMIASAGDVDGDGLADLLFGAENTWANGAEGGRAYLFLSSGALATRASSYSLNDADHRIKGEGEYDYAGRTSVGAGDLDGDGLGDLIITGNYDDVPTAYILLSSGVLQGAGRTIELSDADGRIELPDSIPSADDVQIVPTNAGDLDGDGLADLALGAAFDDTSGYEAGAVFVFNSSGALSGLAGDTLTWEDADRTFLGERSGWRTGGSVVSADDMDGDGATELIIGAPYGHAGGERSGVVYVLRSGGALATGGETMWLEDADLMLVGSESFEVSGTSVSAARDVDGDGLDDLFIGGPRNSNGDRYIAIATLVTSGQLVDYARR